MVKGILAILSVVIALNNNQASIYGYTPTKLAFGTQGLYKPPMQDNSEFSKFWSQESEPFFNCQ